MIRLLPLSHVPGVRPFSFRHGSGLPGAIGWVGLAVGCSSGGTGSVAPGTTPEASESSTEPPFEASSTDPEARAQLGGDVEATPETESSSTESAADVMNGLADASGSAGEASADDATGAPSDAALASDTTTPPCITAGTELCDDFESGTLDPKVWKINLGGPAPTVTVDGVHAHSGKYAVHAKVTPGQQSTAQITEAVTFPANDDAFYTRIWAYFSPAVAWPANPPDFHTGFIIAGGNNDLGHVELAVGANLSPSSAAGPMHYLGYSIYRGPPYVEFGPRSPTDVVTLAWTCVELLESGQGGTTAVRKIWVDGTELPEQDDSFGVSSSMGQKPPQFDLVSIGIWEYHPTPSLSDMWIDDVRVSSQRIGCAS